MKKIKYFTAVMVLGAAGFASTLNAGTCYNNYETVGKKNADVCISQRCTSKTKIKIDGAEWTTCGETTGGNSGGGVGGTPQR